MGFGPSVEGGPNRTPEQGDPGVRGKWLEDKKHIGEHPTGRSFGHSRSGSMGDLD